MGASKPLSNYEREQIYLGRQQGKSLVRLAKELGRSAVTVRKWWRRYRDEGLSGLGTRKRGRKRQGILGSYRLELRDEILNLKRSHPGWGASRVLVELQRDERFRDFRLPSRSRVAAFFKANCPDCLAGYRRHPKRSEHACPATAVHEIWQLDSQENIRLLDGDIATVCSVRDPYGAAMLTSRAVSVKGGKTYRKLTWMEVRQVLRDAFTEWRTLPDSVWTDNEHGLAGNADDPFPSRLTMWLAGLGIRHGFIRPHCPTDQPHIERNHRTLDNLAIDEPGRKDLLALQQALDRERQVYNTLFPCQASDCDGRAPLVAHPELLRPRRPYQPDWEWRLFNLQLVYDFLAHIKPFERKINVVGQVHLGGNRWTIGLRFAGTPVWVRFDLAQVVWEVSVKTGDTPGPNDEILGRCSPIGLDFHSLTGLEYPAPVPNLQPIQLSLPCLTP
jgi:transposase-like protein